MKYTVEQKGGQWTTKVRGGHGAGKHKERCAIGVVYPFELLDSYIGAYLAMHRARSTAAPDHGRAEWQTSTQAFQFANN